MVDNSSNLLLVAISTVGGVVKIVFISELLVDFVRNVPHPRNCRRQSSKMQLLLLIANVLLLYCANGECRELCCCTSALSACCYTRTFVKCFSECSSRLTRLKYNNIVLYTHHLHSKAAIRLLSRAAVAFSSSGVCSFEGGARFARNRRGVQR